MIISTKKIPVHNSAHSRAEVVYAFLPGSFCLSDKIV